MDDPFEWMRTLLAALSDVDCVTVVANGGMDCDDMDRAGHVPSVPQKLVLPAAQLFCTHGGYNSVRESIRAGVPMLVRPTTMDQPVNAQAVARLGLGCVVSGLDGAELAARIGGALADRELAGRARAAQRRALALPGIETEPETLRAMIVR